MFSRIRIIAVFIGIAIGVGIFPHSSLADSPKPARDLFSFFRPFESPAAKNDTTSNASTAVAYHRLARNYANQNNVDKANANFGLALKHAASKQVASIAVDYADFLTGTGDLRGAELILRQALSQSPNDTELIRMLARCLVRQEKVIEGRRHLLRIGTETEANAEIAAIYREQGNMDMLARIEQRWGVASPNVISPATVEPDSMRPEPILIAGESKPVAAPARPGVVQALPRTSLPKQPVLSNPVKLASAPMPIPTVTGTTEPQKPATAPRPRRHYVVNADISSDLEAILPSIRPVGL